MENFDLEQGMLQELSVAQPGTSEDKSEEDSGEAIWPGGEQLKYSMSDSEWYDENDADDIDDQDDLRHAVDELAQTEDDENSESDSQDSGHGTRTMDLDQPRRTSRSRSVTYLFCPLAHRLPVMRLFAKHASQHSLLPERHGQSRTAADIRRDAVHEMYQHCVANNLPEVWAYLWNSWYCSERWLLWARSANSASIPCKRTTMVVESLWRNLKRLTLNLFNRPPVDLASFAIITRTLPPYRLTLARLINSQRPGRIQQLTHMQAALKKSWVRLAKVPIKGSYTTDVHTWTCDCGAQKYHSYLLCKHLVQAVGEIPSSWWPNAIRFHITPFYTVPVGDTLTEPPETKRNYQWLQRMDPGASADLTAQDPAQHMSQPSGEVSISGPEDSQLDQDIEPEPQSVSQIEWLINR